MAKIRNYYLEQDYNAFLEGAFCKCGLHRVNHFSLALTECLKFTPMTNLDWVQYVKEYGNV